MGNQLGDVPHTYADISKARTMLGYEPELSFEKGIEKLIFTSITPLNI